MVGEYQSVEDAMKAVDLAVEETLADNPELEEAEDDVYHDMVQSVMLECDVSVARELGRVTGVGVVTW